MRRKTGSIQFRDTSWRISYYDVNHTRQYESFPTEEEAVRELAKRLSDVAQGIPVTAKPHLVTFGELANDVVRHYQVRKHRSVDDIEARFRVHLNPVFGPRKAASITSAQINHYILQRQAQGAKDGTINRELEAIRRAFNLAFQGRKILTKPHITMLPERNVRSGFFTRAEVDRLCSHLAAPLDSFVLFGFLTGWRYAEIQNLEWRNVDFSAGEIRLDPGTTKNGEGRVFPMTDELRALLTAALAAQRAKADKVKSKVTPASAAFLTSVFTANQKPIGQFRKQWKTACYKAGLPCVVKPVLRKGRPVLGRDGRAAVKVVKAQRIFHDLRRSAAREMERQGVKRSVIMALMGHKTSSMFERYRIVDTQDLRDAVALLNGATGGAREGGGNR